VRRATDLLGSMSDSSLIPSGVISKAQEKISATGKPKMMTMNKCLHHPRRRVERRKENRRGLN